MLMSQDHQRCTIGKWANMHLVACTATHRYSLRRRRRYSPRSTYMFKEARFTRLQMAPSLQDCIVNVKQELRHKSIGRYEDRLYARY